MKKKYFSQNIILPGISFVCTIWTRTSLSSGHGFLEITVPPSYDLSTLPKTLVFQDCLYDRILGRYYIPCKISKYDYVDFWDFISGVYNSVTDTLLHNQIYQIAFERLERNKNENICVLDYGIGTGKYSSAIFKSSNNIEIVGVDISSAMIRCAMEYGVYGVQISDHLLPFASDTFDGVVSCYVIHLLDTLDIFNEWYRVLKTGGAISFNMRLPTKELFLDFNFLSGIGFRELSDEIINIPTKSKLMKMRFVSAKKEFGS